jgi:hypothetical protein
MRSGYLRYVPAIVAAASVLLSGVCGFALNEEGVTKGGKKYPHPHVLHMEAMTRNAADFSIEEIKDWPGFVSALQGKQNSMPFTDGTRMLIGSLKPDTAGSDEKAVIIGELNRLLTNETLGAQVKSIARFSSETKKLETDYRKSGTKEDLAWLNRGIINDLFPQVPKKGKTQGLKPMTCVTCHEAYAPDVKDKGSVVDARLALDCFSQAMSNERPMQECIEMAKAVQKTKIEPYGPMKNYVQKSNPPGDNPLLTAVHPADPYTFKPLLKRLVCIECHSRERKVNKIMGHDGKEKEIPIFYGIGSDKRRGEQGAE